MFTTIYIHLHLGILPSLAGMLSIMGPVYSMSRETSLIVILFSETIVIS